MDQIKVSKFLNKNSSQKGEQIHRRTRILLKCDHKLYNFHIYKKIVKLVTSTYSYRFNSLNLIIN